VLIILSTSRHFFFLSFSKIFGLLRGPKFLELQKYLSEAYYFDRSSPKIAKYAQNMRKYAQT
jgi:hypothetical protein